MSFEHDIFISYARADNYPCGGAAGWVSRFHEELEAWCIRRFGKQHRIRIWRDEALEPNQRFTREIQDQLERSFLFVALNSTNYAASEYCRKELGWFAEGAAKSRGGLVLADGNHSRILNVLLRNIPHTEWRREFGESGAFPLHDAASETELGDPTDPGSPRFREQLRAVVDVVEKLVLRQVARAREAPAPERDAAKPLIFVADVPETLETERVRLLHELSRRGFEAARRIPPPHVLEDHAREVERVLRDCALSVHLFDGSPGKRIDGDPSGSGYPEAQTRIALDSKIPQVVWFPRRLRPEEQEREDLRRVLERLRGPQQPDKSLRLVEGHLGELLDEVEAVVRSGEQASPHSDAIPVLIDTHLEDQLFAAQLWATLERLQVRCLVNQERATAPQRLSELEENLRVVSTLVLVFGKVSYQWVVERLKHCLKLLVAGSERESEPRVRNFFVFLPPGSRGHPEKLEQDLPFLRLRFLDHRQADELKPELLRPLVEAVAA